MKKEHKDMAAGVGDGMAVMGVAVVFLQPLPEAAIIAGVLVAYWAMRGWLGNPPLPWDLSGWKKYNTDKPTE